MSLNQVSSLLQQYYPSVAIKSTPIVPVDLSQTKQMPVSSEPVSQDGTFGADSITQMSRILGHGAGAGVASYKMSGKMAEQYKLVAEAIKTGGLKGATASMKGFALTGVKGAGLAGLVSGGISAITNGVQVARGEVDGKKAINNVITDSISGAVGGLGAVSLSGASHLALARLGVVGVPLTVATTAIGAVGGVIAGYIANKVKAGSEES